jgi:hypothetical protein
MWGDHAHESVAAQADRLIAARSTASFDFSCAKQSGTPTPAKKTWLNLTGNSSAPLTLTVATTLNARLHGRSLRNLPILFCGVLAILSCVVIKQPRKARRLSILAASLMLGSIGCGGGSGSGSGSGVVRQPTNATITVTATSGKHVASNLEKLTILH